MNYDIILKNSVLYPIKYSIIIPTHNSEKYIDNILYDILNLTNKDFELIIVNDCSVDNTLNIITNRLKQNTNLNYILINTKYNLKSGIARNIGIDNASGEYIIFIDSDDSVDVTLIDEMNYATGFNSDIVFYGFTEKYIKKDKLIFSKDINYKNEFSNRLIDKREFDNNIAYFENNTTLGYIWNKCYKKAIIDKYNIRFIDKILYEDLFFNLDYLKHIDKIYICNKLLYTYNNYIDSKSVTKSYDYDYYDLTNYKLERLKDYISKYNIDNVSATDMIKRLSNRYRISYIVRQFESKNYLLKDSKYKINIIEYIYCMAVYFVKKYFYLFYLKFGK